MKKILLVGSAHPLRGGIASLNERLAQAFQDEGHEVEILSFSLQYPNFLFPGTSQYTTDPPPKNLTIRSLLNSINPFNWLWIGYQYRQKRFDLAVFRFWMPFLAPCLGTVARLIRSNGHTQVIAITDNVIPHEKRAGDTWLIRYFLSACQGFLAMSRSVLDELKHFEPQKPALYSPHPLYDHYGQKIAKNEAKKRLNLDEKVPFLLFFGLIRAYKGLDLLLEALAFLPPEKYPFQVLIAGEPYENWEKYQQFIQQNQLADRVILHLHFIPSEEVALYFCAADLVVQPYRTASQSGVSQIAYHFEVPMLVTDVGGLAEIVPHGKVGYAVKPDPKAIGEAIADFFEHQRSEGFIQQLKEEKKRFEWAVMTNRLLDLGFSAPSH